MDTETQPQQNHFYSLGSPGPRHSGEGNLGDFLCIRHSTNGWRAPKWCRGEKVTQGPRDPEYKMAILGMNSLDFWGFSSLIKISIKLFFSHMKKLIGSNSEFLSVAKSLEQRVRKIDENEFETTQAQVFFSLKKKRGEVTTSMPPKLTLDGSLLVHYKISLGEMVGI